MHKTFLYSLKNMSNTKYCNAAKHSNNIGMISWKHNNKERLPSSTMPFESTNYVIWNTLCLWIVVATIQQSLLNTSNFSCNLADA